MVREVFDDGDAVDLGADFKAALDALEGGERFDDGCGCDALAGGERRGGGGVQRVVLAGKVHFEFGPGGRPREEPANCVRPFSWRRLRMLPVGGVAESVALDGAEGAADALGHVFAAVVGDDEAAARNEIDETLECAS